MKQTGRRKPIAWALAGLMGLAAATAHADAAEALQRTLQTRFEGDRTGACAVAALIEQGQVLRAKACAAPRADGGPGFGHVFEIGSVTKTMTAFLVAGLVRQGAWSLDDPIAKHLPPGTELPRQGERQILVRDLLTHSAGLPALPPGFAPRNPSDPYADLSERQLLASLAQVRLERPIGSRFEYSNFGMMIVSAAVARSLGGDYEQALVKQLFEPLKMESAFVNQARSNAPLAQGHLASGQPTSAWHAATNLSGVGMVRASLDDMVRYAQAQLGVGEGLPATLRADMRLSQQPLRDHSAMNWMRFSVQGHELVAHEGGTGGFSSAVVLEPAAQRAVVVLADASLADLGGMGDLAHALLGLSAQPPQARKPAQPSAELRAAMPGRYSLGGLGARIWLQGEQLMAQADGQAAFELGYDSRGDFYPRSFSALLTPVFEQGRVERAVWRQGGGVVEVVRQGAATAVPTASDPRWKDLAGEYALAPGFSLRVFEQEGQLKVQGSGQPAIGAEWLAADRIEVKAVGAVIEFKRDATGQVLSAVLKQNGQTLEGKRK